MTQPLGISPLGLFLETDSRGGKVGGRWRKGAAKFAQFRRGEAQRSRPWIPLVDRGEEAFAPNDSPRVPDFADRFVCDENHLLPSPSFRLRPSRRLSNNTARVSHAQDFLSLALTILSNPLFLRVS